MDAASGLVHAARSVHRPRSHASSSRPLASPSVRPTQLCLRTSLICVFHYAQGKVHSGPGCGSGLIFCPPLAPCPLALPLCPPGGSPLRSLPGCALVSAEASGHTPRPGKGSAAAGQHVAAGRCGTCALVLPGPPPTPLLLWTEPVQGGPLPPRRHPSFTKAGLRPPVRGSTWRASREGLAPTSCSVNINRINHRTS